VALVLPVAGVLATGQASTARFVGLVMDTVGRPLPHLTLVLSRDRDRAEIEAVSDDTGRFEFRDLTPGEYVIRIERPGFDRIQGRIVLYAGQDLEQDIALQVGTVQEEITVTASANAAPPPPPPPPPPPTTPAPTAKRIQRPNEPCGDTQIAGCLDPPIKLHDALPEYPSRQRAAGVEAHVRLEGRIGVDGFVKDLHLAAPVDAEFANAATSAVSEWRFVPTRLGGVPVETPMKVSVNFLAR
jgi:TonB family protein